MNTNHHHYRSSSPLAFSLVLIPRLRSPDSDQMRMYVLQRRLLTFGTLCVLSGATAWLFLESAASRARIYHWTSIETGYQPTWTMATINYC